MKAARTLVIVFTGAFFGAVNCKQVLSIEDAELDPSLTTTGGSSGAAGAGGTAGGGTGGGGGSSGDAGTDGPPINETLCEKYCRVLRTNCADDYQVYQSDRVCLATCARFPEGEPDVLNVNTLHCRLSAAVQAEFSEPDLYCSRAGPGGTGGPPGEANADTSPCATACESWCLMMEAVCNDQANDIDYFTTREACLDECARVPDLGRLSTAESKGQLYGNSVQCRLIHAANSTLNVQQAIEHCPHAAGEITCATTTDGG